MKYKSLFLTLLLSGFAFADLPEVKKFKDVNPHLFEDFFVYEHGKSDGSEMVLSLSHTFIKGFDTNCELSVDIDVFND